MSPDDRLREAWLSGAARVNAGCIPADRLWQAVRDELDASEIRRVLDHVAICPDCARGWQIAHEVASGSDLAAAETSAPSRRPAWNWGGLAAAAALVVALILIPDWTDSPPGFRNDAAATIDSLVSEDQRLSRDTCVLRWSPGPEGTTYALEIATVEQGVLASVTGLEEAQYQLPPSALEDLSSGAKLLWRVDATAPDGSVTSSITFINAVE